MPDQFTETSHRSWGNNILSSIGGALVGIILFLASFAVLWINEGRADLSKIAEKSVVASTQTQNQLVYVTGSLNAAAPIGDSEYLKPGPYIKLDRVVEMYAWQEETEEKTQDKLGGGTDITTTYTYKKTWTSSPGDATKFKYPDGHGNPALSIQGQTTYASPASVAGYGVDAKNMELPAAEAVVLSQDAAITNGTTRLAGNNLYVGKGSPEAPEVGDVRISFEAVRAGKTVTAFGKQDGSQLAPYSEGKATLYRALEGSRDEAISALKTEHKTVGWMLRFIGFFMMWIGLIMCFGPINAVLKVVPFMGSVGRGLTGIVMFLVALVLSAVTIIVAMIAHSVIALVITLVVVAGIIVFIIRKRKN